MKRSLKTTLLGHVHVAINSPAMKIEKVPVRHGHMPRYTIVLSLPWPVEILGQQFNGVTIECTRMEALSYFYELDTKLGITPP